MLNLYAVLLGGRAAGCNTELHDVVFVVGNTLEETYPMLVKKWFGMRHRLHIDASIKLQYVDGHEVVVSHELPKQENNYQLFFCNFGGYRKGYFGELHEVGFYVASSIDSALAKAKQELCQSLFQQHCDDKMLVDDLLVLDKVDCYHIHLHSTTVSPNMNVESHYIKLNVPEIISEANGIS